MKFEKREKGEPIEVKIQGEKIKEEKEIKFFGIVFDKKFKFDTQIELTKSKMRKANSLLRYMNGVNKGMEINTAEMLYKVLVRAVFDYGNIIFFPRQDGKRKGLERMQ